MSVSVHIPWSGAEMGAADEVALVARWQGDGDERARDELVRRYEPATRRLALSYARRHEALEDLQQAAFLGLVNAIDRFDPERGFPFSTFAFPTMSGELKRYLRNTRWAVHMPRPMQERTMAVRRAAERLTRELDRTPTAAEIADALGLSLEDVVDAMLAEGARDPSSLDAPRRADDDPTFLGETIGAIDEDFEGVEDRIAVDTVMGALPERERVIVDLRFGQELSQVEIAARVGCSQMQVSRLLRRAIDRMRIIANYA